MKALSLVLSLAVGLMFSSNLLAAGKCCAKKGAPKHAALDFLKGVTLTTDEQTKVDALAAEYQAKFKANSQKLADVLTPEQKKARKDAVAAAKAAGKKGHDLDKAATAAVTLTADQQAKKKDIAKDGAALHKELKDKVVALLTPEQQDQVKKNAEAHKHGKKK
jgi:hypothetical protein